MIAGLMTDISLLLSAVAILIVAVAGATLVYRKAFKRFEAKLGSMSVSLQAVERGQREVNTKVDSVERAVNNVGEGAPTLVQRVTQLEKVCSTLDGRCKRIEKNQEYERTALAQIAENIGVTIKDRRTQ